MNDLLEPQEGVDPDSLDAAVASVRAFCGWHIAPSRTETVTVDSYGSGTVILPSLHVTEVASVTVDGTPVTDFTSRANGILDTWLWTSRYYPRNGVVVTFTHGYDECPADVREVVVSLAKGNTGGGTVRVGQISVTAAEGSTGLGSPSDRLAPYRRPKLA